MHCRAGKKERWQAGRQTDAGQCLAVQHAASRGPGQRGGSGVRSGARSMCGAGREKRHAGAHQAWALAGKWFQSKTAGGGGREESAAGGRRESRSRGGAGGVSAARGQDAGGHMRAGAGGVVWMQQSRAEAGAQGVAGQAQVCTHCKQGQGARAAEPPPSRQRHTPAGRWGREPAGMRGEGAAAQRSSAGSGRSSMPALLPRACCRQPS